MQFLRQQQASLLVAIHWEFLMCLFVFVLIEELNNLLAHIHADGSSNSRCEEEVKNPPLFSTEVKIGQVLT